MNGKLDFEGWKTKQGLFEYTIIWVTKLMSCLMIICSINTVWDLTSDKHAETDYIHVQDPSPYIDVFKH